MRVVLPIAAIVAILIAAAAVSGGAKLTGPAPVDLAPTAPLGAEPYPAISGPYTGWGVAGLPVTSELGPEAALPSFEVDPLDYYGVSAPPRAWEALAVPSPGEGALVAALVTFADVRAWYGDDPLAAASARRSPTALAAPSFGEGPLAAVAAPLDAK